MKQLLLLFTLAVMAHAQTGLGKSSLTCLDKDGDGWGVGPGCLGPDADDNDASVHSAAQVITAYGSVNAFLVNRGYQSSSTPATVWCISPAGNDSTGASSANADTACTKPYQHLNGSPSVISSLVSPYIVIFRTGTYTQIIYEPPSGTSSQKNVFMSYPGEQATLDISAGVGNAISMGAKSYVIVDGLKVLANPSGSGYSGGTYILYNTGSQTIAFVGNVLRNCEISGGGTDSNVDADNITDFLVEDNVIHDPYPKGGQHNIYLGSNTVASSGVIVRRNILYSVHTGGYPNLQFNGRCTGCYFESNLLYNADGQQIALLEGVSNSFVRNNLAFNTGSTGNPPMNFVMQDYDSGQCQQTGVPSICPWSQTGNTIENNTFWAGTTNQDGSAAAGETFIIANYALTGPCGDGGSPPCGNLGGNFYRNNIIVGPGPVNHAAGTGYPPVVYLNTNPNYLASDTWTNNLIESLDGSAYILGVGAVNGGASYNCGSFNSLAATGSGCLNADPKFAAVNSSYWNSPGSFQFGLLSGSPAIAAGTSTGAPAADIWGTARATPTAIGAIEFGAGTAPVNQVSSVTCAPTSLRSGATATCTMALAQAASTGGAAVALSSNTPDLVVPASAVVPVGSMGTTFAAAAGTVSSAETAVITATLNGFSQTLSVGLSAASTTLVSLTCAPATLTSGTASTCTVTLSQNAGATGTTVALSSNIAVLTVPATVAILSGSSTATFAATAGSISAAQTAVVTATLSGASKTASITLATGQTTGGWQDITNTTLQSVCPPNNFGGMTYPFNSMCPYVINAWGGAAADTKRNRLIIWGGGHTDYSGNEVYSLNLNSTPPAMARLTDPSVFDPTNCPDANADGTPVSRHTYNGLVYIPTADRLFSFDGAKAPCGTGSKHTYTLDLSASPPVWKAMDPTNGYSPLNALGSVDGAICAYDPNSDSVICNWGNNYMFLRYTYQNNTWAELTAYCDSIVPAQSTAVVDPARKLMIFVGNTAGVPQVMAVDISSGSNFAVQDWSSAVTGCDVLATANSPGLAYDAALDRIVGWPNSGNTVYLFNPDTKTCTAQTFGGGPQNAAATISSGTFGRFQYFPSLGAFALVNAANLDAYLLRLNTKAGTVPSCDVNGDGVVDSSDVQAAINQALRIAPCVTADLQQNGVCSVIDVQRVINAVLGGACVVGQ